MLGEGWVTINKPVGLTSFQVVARVRRATGIKKVGHAGTLDPFASGVLVVAVGKTHTRQIESVQVSAKGYWVRMVLGIETDTLDPEGVVTRVDHDLAQHERVTRFLTDEETQRAVLAQWVGTISQTPPRYSAKKISGVPMYELARANQSFDIKDCVVRIDAISVGGIINSKFPTVDLIVRCGKGTYIRSLVRDIAASLGTVAYAQVLVRTNVGDYILENALPYEAIQ